MGADDNIHFSDFQICKNFLLLPRATKAAEQFNAYRKRRKSFLERFEMLESKDRGWREQSDLLVVVDDFKGGAHRYFGLPIAHVSAEQPIHRLVPLHILLNV